MAEVEENDASGRTIIAVCYTNKTLGLAAFDEVSNVIHAEGIGVGLEDVEAVFDKLKVLMNPSMFVVHPLFVANQGLLDLLVGGGDDGVAPPYSYTVSKSTTWNAQAALELMCTKLLIRRGGSGGSDDEVGNGGGGRKGTYLNLAASVDLQCEQVKMSMGALLHYLAANLFSMDDGNGVVAGVRPFPNMDLCRVDTNCLMALQIFQQDHHPNVIKGDAIDSTPPRPSSCSHHTPPHLILGVGRSKEGFSVFSVFDRTKSAPGRQCLRNWMLAPFCNKARILRRQDGVALVVRFLVRICSPWLALSAAPASRPPYT
jgi:hypothetical protein